MFQSAALGSSSWGRLPVESGRQALCTSPPDSAFLLDQAHSEWSEVPHFSLLPPSPRIFSYLEEPPHSPVSCQTPHLITPLSGSRLKGSEENKGVHRSLAFAFESESKNPGTPLQCQRDHPELFRDPFTPLTPNTFACERRLSTTSLLSASQDFLQDLFPAAGVAESGSLLDILQPPNVTMTIEDEVTIRSMLLEPSYDKQTAEEFHASDWENFLGDTFTPWADDFAGDHSKDCFVDADVTKSSQSLYSCTWLGEEKESRQTIDDQVEEVSFLQASDGLEEKVVLQAVSEATLDPLHQQAFSSPPSSPPFPSARGHDRSLEALPVPNKVDGDQWPLGNAQFMSQMSQMTCSQMAAITSQMNNMAALNQAPSLPVQSAESLPVSPGATHMLPGMFSPMIAGACAAASSLTVPGTPSGLGPSSPPASVIQVPPLPRGLLARRSLMFQGSLEAGAGFTLPLAPPLLVPPPSGLALHPISLLQAQISSIKSVTAAANAQAAASASTSGSSRVNSLPTPRATPRATPRPTPRATPRATPAWSAGLPSPHPEAAGHDQPGHPSPAAASYQDELIFHDEDLQDSAEDAAEDTCQQSTRRRGGGSEKDKEFVQNTAAKAARKRRLGVNSRLKILEDLVPLSGKGDTARMLSEVQDYIAQMLASIGVSEPHSCNHADHMPMQISSAVSGDEIGTAGYR